MLTDGEATRTWAFDEREAVPVAYVYAADAEEAITLDSHEGSDSELAGQQAGANPQRRLSWAILARPAKLSQPARPL